MTSTKYQVLARRYRPQRFSEVVGQESAVTTLKNALRFDKAAHAYLFCGSRGVGKTTLARLFAKALNCLEKGPDMEPCNRCSSCLEIGQGNSLDVIEIDGASNRGIDDIRQINETALYSPSSGRYKIYIIDEVHMLTKEAFNALLKTLEEPPEKAKFFFATTEPHKVLPTIVSRCQRFDLGRIQLSQVIGKLEEIAADLGRTAEPEAFHLIAAFSDGSLRDAESLFDQILCFAEGSITAHVVRASLGLIPQEHFFALDQAFSEAKAAFAFELVETLFSSGKDLAHFYEQLIEHVRNLSCARLLGEKGLSLPPDLAARYFHSSRLYASSQCLYLLEYLLRSESQLQKSACQRVALEAILLHYIQSKHRIPMEVLVRHLMEMENALKAAAMQMPPKSLEPVPDLKSNLASPSIPNQTLHQNTLKQECIQEALQNLSSEQATTPSAQRASNANNEVKPMQSKIDSPDCFSTTSASTGVQSIPQPKIEAPPLPIALKPVPFNPYKSKQEAPSLSSYQKDPTPLETKTTLSIPTENSKEETQIPPSSPKIVPQSIDTKLVESNLEIKQLPAETEAFSQKIASTSPNPKIMEMPEEKPVRKKERDSIQPILPEQQVRFDTLMRFATVELEGTLKLGE